MKTFLEFLEEQYMNEAGFEVGGKKYTYSFGKYYRDGERITRDEYWSAKEKTSSTDSSAHAKKSEAPRQPKISQEDYDYLKSEHNEFVKSRLLIQSIEDTIEDLQERMGTLGRKSAIHNWKRPEQRMTIKELEEVARKLVEDFIVSNGKRYKSLARAEKSERFGVKRKIVKRDEYYYAY